MEFSLVWAALTGVGAVWAGTRLWREGLPPKAVDLLVGAAAVGMLVGRIAEMIAQGINPFTDPVQILLVRGGVSTGFASLGSLLTIGWVTRLSSRYLDALAPAAVIGLAGWHAGCVWRSACLGTQSDLPWAWAQSGSDITRHPVEIYAAIAFLAAAFAVSRLPWRPFARTGSAVAAAGLVRLVTQPMRLTLTGGPIEWYAAAVVFGLGLAVFGAAINRRIASAPT